jgi:hypothetical protein
MHSDITSVLTGQPLGIWVGQGLSTAQFGSPVQSLAASATRRAGTSDAVGGSKSDRDPEHQNAGYSPGCGV